MSRVFSLWLLDIAKYIVTALVLSSALGGGLSGWAYYAASLGLVAVIVLGGVFLFKKSEKKEREEKEKNV